MRLPKHLSALSVGVKEHMPKHTNESSPPISLAVAAMGVVYGDIGTSPLYALRECFHESHGLTVTADNILGILSLIVWSLVLVVTDQIPVVCDESRQRR